MASLLTVIGHSRSRSVVMVATTWHACGKQARMIAHGLVQLANSIRTPTMMILRSFGHLLVGTLMIKIEQRVQRNGRTGKKEHHRINRRDVRASNFSSMIQFELCSCMGIVEFRENIHCMHTRVSMYVPNSSAAQEGDAQYVICFLIL